MNIFDILRKLSKESVKNMSPKTNGDRIRAMTDEELAEKITALDLGEVPYCSLNDARCNEMAKRNELITPEMCKKCCIAWLQKEAEGE